MFNVLWHCHGGSGLSMTKGEYLALDLDERDWLTERIDNQREDEAAAIKRASKKK